MKSRFRPYLGSELPIDDLIFIGFFEVITIFNKEYKKEKVLSIYFWDIVRCTIVRSVKLMPLFIGIPS